MKKLLVASVAAGTVLAAVPVQAHPTHHYEGECGFFTVSDGTDSPQTKWDGEIHAVAVATDAAGAPAPTASITVDCELRINGATPGTIVFSCSTPGIGFVSCAGQFSFNADPEDVVTMCDIVTVGGNVHKDCGDTPPPHPIPEVLLDVIDEAVRIFDEAACAAIRDQDGGPADQPPTFDIRTDGDIYVNGEWFWDCPPYGTSGPPGGAGGGLLGCDDGLDNDADGRTDSADPGCANPDDQDERGTTACDDGADNDNDAMADYPADSGCTGPHDTDETGPGACADGVDNDGDLAADGSDPGCSGSSDPSERGSSACDDGADNDDDGHADYPVDPGCNGPGDGNERGGLLPCDDGTDNDNDGRTDYPADTGCRSAADPNETTIP